MESSLAILQIKQGELEEDLGGYDQDWIHTGNCQRINETIF